MTESEERITDGCVQQSLLLNVSGQRSSPAPRHGRRRGAAATPRSPQPARAAAARSARRPSPTPPSRRAFAPAQPSRRLPPPPPGGGRRRAAFAALPERAGSCAKRLSLLVTLRDSNETLEVLRRIARGPVLAPALHSRRRVPLSPSELPRPSVPCRPPVCAAAPHSQPHPASSKRRKRGGRQASSLRCHNTRSGGHEGHSPVG